jgi:hypothetical protein
VIDGTELVVIFDSLGVRHARTGAVRVPLCQAMETIGLKMP